MTSKMGKSAAKQFGKPLAAPSPRIEADQRTLLAASQAKKKEVRARKVSEKKQQLLDDAAAHSAPSSPVAAGAAAAAVADPGLLTPTKSKRAHSTSSNDSDARSEASDAGPLDLSDLPLALQARFKASLAATLAARSPSLKPVSKRSKKSPVKQLVLDHDDDEIMNNSSDEEDGPPDFKHDMHQAKAASAAAAASRCRFCDGALPLGFNSRFCPHTSGANPCGLVLNEAFDSPQNTAIRTRAFTVLDRAAAAATTTGQPTSSATPDATNRLDRYFSAMLKNGDDYPAFTDPSPVTQQWAVALLSESVGASEYARPSPQLLKYVASGKMTQLGETVPLTLHQARSSIADSSSSTTVVVVDGRNASSGIGAVTGTDLPNYQSFLDAFFGTIIPACIEQPKALIYFTALARTVTHLNSTHDWATASDYITRILNKRVNARTEFGTQDIVISIEVIAAKLDRDKLAAEEVARERLSRAALRPASSAPATSHDSPMVKFAGQYCRQWNSGSCPREDAGCRYVHDCRNKGADYGSVCKTSKQHTFSHCSHRNVQLVQLSAARKPLTVVQRSGPPSYAQQE